LLLRLLETQEHESVLIFTRTKHRADRVTRQVRDKGYKAAVLHSDRSQGQRQRALDGFRDGRYQLLIATDIAARGLDVQGISHVINYDIPGSADDYIHRIGRTGRAERTGDALTLVTSDDRATIKAIERCLGEPLPVREVDDFAEGVRIRAPRKLPQRTSPETRRKAAEMKERAGNAKSERLAPDACRAGSRPRRRLRSRRERAAPPARASRTQRRARLQPTGASRGAAPPRAAKPKPGHPNAGEFAHRRW